jgi:antitoxin component YwqK of YwqJK toxin-antitoxin module
MLQYKVHLATVLFAVFIFGCANDPGTTEAHEPEVMEVVDYHDNGTVSKQGISIDGQRSGLWQSYYPSGLKWSETTFRNGVKEGTTVTYFSNGMMRYSGFFHDDHRSGKWVFYDTLGVVIGRVDMDVNPRKADAFFPESPPAN